MHSSLRVFSFCLLLAGFQAALFGQATVEGAVAAGSAAITTAPSANIGKNINGLAGAVNGALKGANGADAGSSGTTTRQTIRPTTTKGTKLAAPAPDRKLGDPADIETGMTNEEVMRRFGPPNLRITEDDAISLLYTSKSGRVKVQMRDGKVASVEKPKF